MKKTKYKFNKRGFTLVETIIYIAIIGSVVTSFLYFGIAIFDYRSKAYVSQEVQANIRMSLDVISKKIRSAKEVNINESVFDVDPGRLSLVMDDEGKSPTIISLNQDDGVLQIVEGLENPVPITTEGVSASSLIFKNLTSNTDIENIGIEIMIEYNNLDQNVKYNYSDVIETAISLRR